MEEGHGIGSGEMDDVEPQVGVRSGDTENKLESRDFPLLRTRFEECRVLRWVGRCGVRGMGVGVGGSVEFGVEHDKCIGTLKRMLVKKTRHDVLSKHRML